MANRVCQQCGTPLAPGQTFCSNCGSYVEPGAGAPTERASSYPAGSSSGQSPIEPTQYAGPPSPYGSPSYGSPSYGPSSPSQGQGYAPPPPPSSVPYGAAPGTYGQQPGQFGAGFPQAPQPKKGPGVGLIIGIVALLVILVGGGLFFLTRPKTGGNTNNPPNSSPVVHGTTPTAVPTPQPLFADNFANNSKGWATGNNNGFSRTIANSKLTLVENNQGHILPESLPTNTTFNDFTVTVTLTFEQGDQNDSVGLYMRGDTNLDHDYRVDINGDNTYAIAREYVDSSNTPKQQFIVRATNSSAIKPIGQQNTITVIMKGSRLVLLINGTMVNSISDSNYTSGQIALYAAHGTTSNGTRASFTSVAVYPAPNQLPG